MAKFGRFLKTLKPYIVDSKMSNKEYLDYFINLFLEKNDKESDAEEEMRHYYLTKSTSTAAQILNDNRNIDPDYADYLISKFDSSDFIDKILSIRMERHETLCEQCRKYDIDVRIDRIEDDLSNEYENILQKLSKNNKSQKDKPLSENQNVNESSFSIDDLRDHIKKHIEAQRIKKGQTTNAPNMDDPEVLRLLVTNDFLQKIKYKYDSIRTILYKNESIKFNDLYVCNDINVHVTNIINNNLKKELQLHPNLSAFDIKNSEKNILIRGTGGLGKTMMLRHILLNAIDTYKENHLIPIFINIRDYKGKDRNIETLIEDFIAPHNDDFYNFFYKEEVKNGHILFLFDGLDEIDPKYKSEFDYDLSIITNHYDNNKFVMSSRDIGTLNTYDNFLLCDLCPLSQQQSIELIKKLKFREDEPEIKAKFIDAIRTSLYKNHKDFVENPLLLTILLMTYNQYGNIPDKLYKFYERSYSVITIEHDAFKGAKRYYKTGLTSDDLEKIFALFCARTYYFSAYNFDQEAFKGYMGKVLKALKYNISIEDIKYDIVSNLCLMYEDANKLFFTHRSFQEYFTAVYLNQESEQTLQNWAEELNKKNSKIGYDNVLSMLYDMNKDRVERLVIYPYLDEKIKYWHDHGDYFGYLEDAYNELQYGDYEDVKNSSTKIPALNFIINKNNFTKRTYFMDFEEDDEFCVGEYYCIKSPPYTDEDNYWETVDESEIPEGYDSENFPPDYAGKEFTVSFYDIFEYKDDYTYKDFYETLTDEKYPLKIQYNQILNYHEELKREIENRAKSTSLFDD